MRSLQVVISNSCGTLVLSAALLVALASPVRAADTAPPPYLAFIDGAATLEREGQSQSATINLPLVDGDQLRTSNSRIEMLFPDGTALSLAEFSTMDVRSSTLIRLVEGRVILNVARGNDRAGTGRYQIDTPVASIR